VGDLGELGGPGVFWAGFHVGDRELGGRDARGWKEALGDVDAYKHEQPLPEVLGQIFLGGKKKKPAG
jgi:hypothetical protein